jgi:hypothetical protein
MQVLDRKDSGEVKLLIDEAELQRIYNDLSDIQLKKQFKSLLLDQLVVEEE